jgi:hypothetical protein
VEQVDPQQDSIRSSLGIKSEIYTRIYLQCAHTSPLGEIKGYPVKLSFALRYFAEFDPPKEIKKANRDEFKFFTVALQLPSAIIPNLETDKGSLVISYSSGKLPFDRTDENVFELGWQTNFNLGDMFKP